MGTYRAPAIGSPKGPANRRVFLLGRHQGDMNPRHCANAQRLLDGGYDSVEIPSAGNALQFVVAGVIEDES
jgi:hypothetical protein